MYTAAKKIPPLVWAVRAGRSLFGRDRGASTRRGLMRHITWAADEDYQARIEAKTAQLESSSGTRYFQKHPARIGLICDRFFYDSVFAAAEFVYLSPNDWEPKIQDIDCLLIVSTWQGLKNDDWRGCSGEGTAVRRLQYRIVQACKEKNIPTVFYSKEDPTNYKVFITLAQRCDYVFTTAEEVVNDYKRDCGHERVFVMRFGINPLFHNPIGMQGDRSQRVIFSGSWIESYLERCRDLAIMLDGAVQSGRGARIVDRNFRYQNPLHHFPDRFSACVAPPLPHDVLMRAHKCYDWAINVNTVKQSETMFANRVCELQASGNLMLSNFSVGVNRLFPTLFMPHDEAEAAAMLTCFSEEELYERKVSGVRRVMTGETCFDRIQYLLNTVGISGEQTARKAAVILQTEKGRANFSRQTYPHKTVFFQNTVTENDLAAFDIITFMSDEAFYSPFYLEDMINAFKYTACDYVTKAAFFASDTFTEGPEHAFTDTMASKYRTVFWKEAFDAAFLLKLSGPQMLKNGYALDRFNYDENPVEKGVTLSQKKITVAVEVASGWALYGKAFASLRRSSLFDSLEILLLNQTDPFCTELARRYPNVRCTESEQEASAPYLFKMKAEHEVIGDGLCVLLTRAQETNAGIVFGRVLMNEMETTLAAPPEYGALIRREGGHTQAAADSLVFRNYSA